MAKGRLMRRFFPLQGAAAVRRLALGLLALGSLVVTGANAQLDPRMTGATMIGQLESAQHDLSVRASQGPDAGLPATSQKVLGLITDFRKDVGTDLQKPVEKLGDTLQSRALRMLAATEEIKAFLAACATCAGGEASLLAAALSADIDILLNADSPWKDALRPMIDRVETADHRPIFAIREGSSNVAIAIIGANFDDPKCADPVVTATDSKGDLQNDQPTVTGILPNRIDMKLPDGLAAGGYVLHVKTKHRSTIYGCSSTPDATIYLQVAPRFKTSASFTVSAVCESRGGAKSKAGGASAPAAEAFPDITVPGMTVSKHLSSPMCADPVSYTLSASITFQDGNVAAIGPVDQNAAASITIGAPNGLSISFDPSIQTAYLRSSPIACGGIY